VVVDWLEIAVLIALWSFTLWRFVTPQSRRGKAIRLVALLITLSFTFNQRGIAYATDQLTHVPDICVPLKNLATVAASAAMVHTVGLMSVAPRTHTWLRRWAYGFLATAAVGMMAVFFVVPRSPARGGFLEEQAGTPAVVVYATLTQLSLAVGLFCALVLFRPTGKRAEPGPLRTGLRLLSAGAVVGLLFMLNRLAYMLTHAAGSRILDTQWYVDYVSRNLLALALLFMAVGAAYPALGRARRWAAHYRALHRLRPLWRELCGAVPSVVLGDPPGVLGELFALRSLELRLYRRIIEIRDAQWHLAGEAAPAVDRGRLPAGITEDELPLATEALVLRTAIESGAQPGRPSAPARSGGPDVDGEIRALLVVSRFYRSLRPTPTPTPSVDARTPAALDAVATPVDTIDHSVQSG
jgi:hypothetical protein